MKYLIMPLLFFIFSCKPEMENKANDFNEKVVSFAIENSNNKFIELPGLYDSLPKEIAADADEKLILVQILKKKNFKIINWGRGNHPLGPRTVSLTLKKGNCECEVQKIYYATDSDPGLVYKATESIKCNKTDK